MDNTLMKNYFNQSSSVLYYNYIFILMLKFTNLRTAFICNIIHKEKNCETIFIELHFHFRRKY